MTDAKMIKQIHNYFYFIIMLTMMFIFIKPVNAGSDEEEVFSAFEWFCLSHLNNQESVPSLFENIGVDMLPETEALKFLSPQTGKAWLLPGKFTKGFIVGLSDSGSCTVFGPHVKGDESKALFEKMLKSRLLTSEPIGSQEQNVYAVSFPDPSGNEDIHAMAFITTSKLKTLGDGVIFNAIPESLLKKNGIEIPNWP